MQVSSIGRVKSAISYRSSGLAEHSDSFSKKMAGDASADKSVNLQNAAETAGKSFWAGMDYRELRDKLMAQSEAANNMVTTENGVSYQIGANSFTEDEWDRFLENFDSIEEVLRELMRERIKKMEEKTLEKKREDRIRDEEYAEEKAAEREYLETIWNEEKQ